jgi:high-affinity iron transporter
MLAGFLLSLREGLEAALVIGIVLGVLHKLNRPDLNRTVWSGLAAATGLSIAIAVALAVFGMEFVGLGEMIFEGSAMLLAAGVLTWMILWMQQSTRNLKNEIEAKTQNALRGQSGRGLFTLAFLAVFREGVELALFLLAVEKASSPIQTLIGALTGLTGAALLGWLLFSSSRKMNLRSFFSVTNTLLIIFAAGMVAVGVHEFNEAGIIPALIDPVWNINGILSDNSEVGLLLKALVGYNGNPSLSELLAYGAYLTSIGAYIFIRKQKVVPPTLDLAG